MCAINFIDIFADESRELALISITLNFIEYMSKFYEAIFQINVFCRNWHYISY